MDENIAHGKWLIEKDDFFNLTIATCSQCGNEWCFEVDDDLWELNYHYCPNCGARMDGDT